MIALSNGHKIDIVAASGAMGYTGDGYLHQRLYYWLNYINPYDLTIITKTLTHKPLKGNYKSFKPWQTVRNYKNYVINAYGLTNNGYEWWLNKPLKRIIKKKYSIIPSILPFNADELYEMIKGLNRIDEIKGIQLNLSCPNTGDKQLIESTCSELIDLASKESKHPVIVKLGITTPYLEVCKKHNNQPKIEAFELINSVPWKHMFPAEVSPLEKYKHKQPGALSGPIISRLAVKALVEVKAINVKTPIISGGGIYSLMEMLYRDRMGADGLALGTVFLKHPRRPRTMIKEYRRRVVFI